MALGNSSEDVEEVAEVVEVVEEGSYKMGVVL